jgi:hypothetical protein
MSYPSDGYGHVPHKGHEGRRLDLGRLPFFISAMLNLIYGTLPHACTRAEQVTALWGRRNLALTFGIGSGRSRGVTFRIADNVVAVR